MAAADNRTPIKRDFSQTPNQSSNSDLPRLPDLVLDSKLETRFHSKYTSHRYYDVGNTPYERSVVREEYWRRQGPIGRGSYGRVWLERCAKGQRNHDVRAVKEIWKPEKVEQQLIYYRELEAIAKFSHPRYIRCFVESLGWYENAESMFLAMEYFPHGDLHNYMVQSPALPESEVRIIIFQLTEGLCFLHQNDFAHRDLKPSNILIQSKPPDTWWVKIGDFGISKRAEEGAHVSTTIKGTLDFMSPEIRGFVQSKDCFPKHSLAASSASDMWALGETMFQLLTKRSTFPDLRSLITCCEGRLPFPSIPTSCQISKSGNDFFGETMRVAPVQRLDAKNALGHVWMEPCRGPSPRPASLASSGSLGIPEGIWDADPYMSGEPSAKWSTVSYSNEVSQTTEKPLDTSSTVVHPSNVLLDLPLLPSDSSRSTTTSKEAAKNIVVSSDYQPTSKKIEKDMTLHMSHLEANQFRLPLSTMSNTRADIQNPVAVVQKPPRHQESSAKVINAVDSRRGREGVFENKKAQTNLIEVFQETPTVNRAPIGKISSFADVRDALNSLKIIPDGDDSISPTDGSTPVKPYLVRALHDWKVEHTGLSFKVGDILQVIAESKDGWFDGIGGGYRGWFPRTYCVKLALYDPTALEGDDQSVIELIARNDWYESGGYFEEGPDVKHIISKGAHLPQHNSVIDVLVAEDVLRQIQQPEVDEFRYFRHTQVKCEPRNFKKEQYMLRPLLFFTTRIIKHVVVINISSDISGRAQVSQMAKLLRDTFAALAYLCKESPYTSHFKLTDPWKSGMLIVRTRFTNEELEPLYQRLGLRFDRMEGYKSHENTRAYIREYTVQLTFKELQYEGDMGGPYALVTQRAQHGPIQFIDCQNLHSPNQVNAWPQAFSDILGFTEYIDISWDPKSGKRPPTVTENAIYKLWKENFMHRYEGHAPNMVSPGYSQRGLLRITYSLPLFESVRLKLRPPGKSTHSK